MTKNSRLMKTILKPIILPVILTLFFVFVQTFTAISQAPPPPPGEKGSGTNQGPMGAPIAGGAIIFLAFGAGLAGWQLYRNQTRKTAE
jgi:hypothetical protein